MLLCLFASAALADNWGPYEAATIPSPSGGHRLHTDPEASPHRQPRLRMTDGRSRQIYDVPAANRIGPVGAWVSDDGYAVTSGEWGRAGYEHAIVIYDPSGQVVVDLHLDEVLTPAELLVDVQHSASSRWWIQHDEPSFVAGDIVFETDWGQGIRFRLRDGQQFRGDQPIRIPSRAEAFAGWLADPSALAALEVEVDDTILGRRGRTAASTGCIVTETSIDCEQRSWKHCFFWNARFLEPRRWQQPHEAEAFWRLASRLVGLQAHLVEQYANPEEHHAYIQVALQPHGIPGASPRDRLVYNVLVTQRSLRDDAAAHLAFDALLEATGLPGWPGMEG